ncbi:exonuclease subunit SbcD [Psychromonas sp. PT13]|uniref:exonuclease subunit SbcD n=1 Tax=Psychromonas sp. PT13 TaxID=3439547 RepID=UPI003EBC0B1E
MKILHTSDWHLGQYFMMKTREAEHLSFLNWLVALIKEQQIDAVIVAGDIFDSSAPPSYARKLYSDFIVKLQDSGCNQLIIVSGNHDSVAVLNESKSLLNALNVSVLAGLNDELSEHIVTLKDKDKQDAAIVCALPFLRAGDVMGSEAGLSAERKQQNLQRGIEKIYTDIYQIAQLQCQEKTLPIIATGHLTSVGCSVSESERDIYIGTLSAFPASLFPAFDYIALGHLHRSQKVQKSDVIRYSGSPIPLSFAETKHDKQVMIVDFLEQGEVKVTPIVIPRFQDLQVIKGSLEEVSEQLKTLASEKKQQSMWLEIKLNQSFYVSDVQSQLNSLVEGTNIEILKISSPKLNENSQWQETDSTTLDDLTPVDLFQHRLKCEDNLSEQQQTELKALFVQVCEALEDKA